VAKAFMVMAGLILVKEYFSQEINEVNSKVSQSQQLYRSDNNI
jgi:hypothetical protein